MFLYTTQYPAEIWQKTGDAHSLPTNASSTEFRRGMNEAGYVRGLYELWDNVRHRHPDLIIDNCASGGRRHDLETMSRSVPLWPSDYSCGGNEDLGGMQSMSMGLSRWLPVHGGAFLGVDPYAWRSVSIGTKNCDWGKAGWTAMSTNATIVAQMQRATKEARELEALASDSADFWPLTAIHPSDTLWAAWQLHRPHRDDGFVMYFRRSLNKTATFAVPWPAGTVSSASTYDLEYRYDYTVDEAASSRPPVDGKLLLAAGLEVTLDRPMSSLLVRYRRAAQY
jgi:alpha-galactosidase